MWGTDRHTSLSHVSPDRKAVGMSSSDQAISGVTCPSIQPGGGAMSAMPLHSGGALLQADEGAGRSTGTAWSETRFLQKEGVAWPS